MNNDLLQELCSYRSSIKEFYKRGLQREKIDYYEFFLNARYCKVSRIKKRFVYLLTRKRYVYFLTFTFDNDLLEKCDRTKRDLIKTSLMSFDKDLFYILNVDYGSINEREHYHCLVGTDLNADLGAFLDRVYPSYSYTEKVRLEQTSIAKLTKYLNKLSNHAVKDSTKNKRIVYNFKGYDTFKELGRYMYILDRYNLDL